MARAYEPPNRKRKGLQLHPDPAAEHDLLGIAARVQYTCSSEHMSVPKDGIRAAPKDGNSLCPPGLTTAQVYQWLVQAIKQGCISEVFDGDFPKRVWYRADDGVVYEGRLTNRESGAYKGWPAHSDEIPKGI